MSIADKYLKIIEWSDEDACFIGSCPELFYGGCHGTDVHAVLSELCQLIEEAVQLHVDDAKPLPPPMSGLELVNSLQRAG